jgi:hypothetical protein
MRAAEIIHGAKGLGIVHYPTLPHSPYQNGKQETFWSTVEERLMAMLENVEPLQLGFLNQATAAWVELEYNKRRHSELGISPLEKMLTGKDVSRKSPPMSILQQRFIRTKHPTQRKSDGTISIKGVRFELPNRLRTLHKVLVGYQSWDLSMAYVLDERSHEPIARILPLDKERNASGRRRVLQPLDEAMPALPLETRDPVPPLMRRILEEYAATGLPPSYLPKDELPSIEEGNHGEK